MGVKDRTVTEFLAAVAAPTPTPGGGSVSALAGALSVALSRMVVALARKNAAPEAARPDLEGLEPRAQALQDRLERLTDEDAAAYDAVVAAMRLPRTTDDDKRRRVDALQAAYRHATRIPLETIAACVEALEIAEEATVKGSRSATTDAGVAVVLAEAAIRGARLNCIVNLAAVRDESFREDVEGSLNRLLERAKTIGQRTMALVEERL